MNHWLCIQLSDDRTYGGNPGYGDVLGQRYEYDSFVPNHLQVVAGDIICLRDRTKVLGIGMVDEIARSRGLKRQFRCPICGISQIKERKSQGKRFRCRKGHEFEAANEVSQPCTRYVASFRQPFLKPLHPVDAKTIRRSELRPSDQVAIARANFGLVLDHLRSAFPSIDDLMERASLAASLPSDAGVEMDFEPNVDLSSALDSRERALREIRLRRGAVAFRRKMLRRFGNQCAISGCRVVDVLEAAHIKPYRGTNDNHAANGLLLRTDLHTLFDLNLLAIEPSKLNVCIHPKLMDSEYAELHGVVVTLPRNSQGSVKLLQARWTAFLDAGGTAAMAPR